LPIWQLVTQKIVTLHDLETIWSLDDVMRALALLNMKNDVESDDLEKMNDSQRTSH